MLDSIRIYADSALGTIRLEVYTPAHATKPAQLAVLLYREEQLVQEKIKVPGRKPGTHSTEIRFDFRKGSKTTRPINFYIRDLYPGELALGDTPAQLSRDLQSLFHQLLVAGGNRLMAGNLLLLHAFRDLSEASPEAAQAA